ncbi:MULTISPECIES: carboxymuconolactone decarboxylase family protein [Nonlabens]|uniref:Alkylhydroperoxidase n=1 Tax=Nonlabens ulvanivorans TaxID=906888 RepID=A0A081DC49_NONUL|nr:carboxymuconolactone decarboxylase family protein [Nonlabens ulvanivorans]KEZ94137.1 alkylhydroperoxidase [Nonlabens ulvanivorans]PRX13126.1 putative peroxidase-related enzyme [Nonlabens ulvanivorans]WOI21778.1 carboxymuconolactone decarboxylase family protein [Nonlabens ulvanivorans]GAK76495.1 alkylhydroperoxidase AhpD core [Nonlabens ulvanivorans]GAK89873.1 alkylhydroperoxidase AhpD core [Nonlabens ulvanivorans]
MATFNVPQRSEVNEVNQGIFDNLEKQLGFVPNLYATYALSNNALNNYLSLSGAKTSLNNKEKEVVNLAVSEVNGCDYCLAAHTAIAQMNGFTQEQTLELRAGKASFQTSYNALAGLAKNITENRGRADKAVVDSFLAAGYTQENLVDTIVLVGDKTISNYLHNTTQVPVDFPAVEPLGA